MFLVLRWEADALEYAREEEASTEVNDSISDNIGLKLSSKAMRVEALPLVELQGHIARASMQLVSKRSL